VERVRANHAVVAGDSYNGRAGRHEGALFGRPALAWPPQSGQAGMVIGHW
jgi:hypothetical protein